MAKYRPIDQLNLLTTFLSRELGAELAWPQWRVFLDVATHKGTTVAALCERLGMPQGTASRNIKEFSRYKPQGKSVRGYDLIYQLQDMEERRRYILMLTDKGKQVAERINRTLGKAVAKEGDEDIA